jgi:TP901 family phage tail tape measure protein
MASNDLLISIVVNDNSSTRQIKALQSSIIRLVGAVASLAATLKTLAFPLQEIVAFEKELTNVAKTTDIAGASLQQLGRELRALSTTTGVAATDLAKIAAAAGQLGLGSQGQDALLSFTETVARFSQTVDISVDLASTSLAKLANIFQLPIDQSERLASSLNELSNTTTATGDQLLDVIRRVGDAGGLLDFADAAAFAAQAIQLGQSPEVAGTAISKLFQSAAENADDFSKAVGLSTEEFATFLRTDAVGAIQLVGTELSKLDTVAQAQGIKTLFGAGRQGAFGQKFVQDAANNYAILNAALENSNVAYEDGQSAIREYQKISESTSRQIDILVARFKELALQAGDILLPVLRESVIALQGFFADAAVQERVRLLAENVASAAKSIIDFTVAIANNQDAIDTLVTALELLVALGIAKMFTSAGAAVFHFGARLKLTADLLRYVGLNAQRAQATMAQLAAGSNVAQILQQINAAKAAAAAAAGGIAAGGAATGGAGAAAAAAVSNQQKALNGLITTKIGLMQQLSVLEADILNKARQQAVQQRLGTQAIQARLTAVQQAVAAGFAQAKADEVQLRSLQARLLAVNQAIVQQQTLVSAATGTAAATATAGIGLFQRLGGAVLRFLTGPWAALLLAFGSFYAIVKQSFSGVEKEFSDSVVESTNKARAAFKKLEEDITKFREEQARFAKTGAIQIAVDADLSQFQSTLDEGVKRLVDKQQAVAGAFANEEMQVAALTRLFGLQTQINKKIEEEKRLRDELLQTVRLSSPSTLVGQEAREDVVKVLESLQESENTAQGLTRAIEQTKKAIADSAKESDEFARNYAGLAKAIADSFTKADVAVLKNVGSLNEMNAQLQESEKRISQLGAKRAGGSTLSADEEIELSDLQVKASGLRTEITALSDAIGESGARLQRVLGAAFTRLTQVAEGTTELSEGQIKALQFIEDNANAIDDVSTSTQNLIRRFIQLRAKAQEFGAQSKVFDVLVEKVEETTKGIRGIFDNLDTSSRSTRNEVANLTRELRAIPERRKIELETTFLDEQGIGGFVDRHIKRIQDTATDVISRIDRSGPGGEAAARAVERQRDFRVAALEVQKKNNEALAEEAKLQRDVEEAQAEQLRLISEAAALRDRIANQDTSTAGGVLAQRENFIALEQLNKALDEQLDKIKDSASAYAEFNGVVQRDIFTEMAGFDQVVNQDDVNRVTADVERFGEQTIKAQAGLLTTAADLSDELDASAKSMNVYGEQAKAAREESDQIAAALSLSRETIEAISAVMADIESKAAASAQSFRDLANVSASGPIQFDFRALNEQLSASLAETESIMKERLEGVITDAVRDGALGAEGLEILLDARIEKLQEAVRLAQQNELPQVEITAQIKLEEAVEAERENTKALVSEVFTEGVSEGVIKGITDSTSDIQGLIRDALKDIGVQVAPRAGASAIEDLNASLSEDEKSLDASVQFDETQVQSALNELKGLTLPVEVAPGTGTIPGNADGGYIRGPGTGRSDSILSWLSNGEYVIDAATTRKFGPSFFAALQQAARRGFDFDLPRFALGGFVGNVSGGSDSGSDPLLVRDVVDVNLNVGGESFSLMSDRDQVRNLKRALRNLSRGGSR